MANDKNCPAECRVRLTSLEGHRLECEQDRRETYKHWEEELKTLTPKKTFFWVVGWMIFVLVASFGALFLQGRASLFTLHEVEKKQVAVQTTLADLVKHHDNANKAFFPLQRESDSEQ